GLDNVQFLSRDLLIAVEDAGDTLHTQRNALDSGFVFDVTADYSRGLQPIRFLAEGRDASATLDASNGGFGKNDGDNEITGPHVSDGDPSSAGSSARRCRAWAATDGASSGPSSTATTGPWKCSSPIARAATGTGTSFAA